MVELDALAERFDEHRPHLVAIAYRMLGSLAEADDAVQETWFRLQRSDASAIDNLGAWLTTVVSRICLSALRSRATHGETALETPAPQALASRDKRADPEQEMLLADAVGFAMLVVLDALDPAERLAFVLHDMFAIPFDEIAMIVGRSPAAARQLASRARRRVQGRSSLPKADVAQHRQVVEAFLAASRRGDFEALVALLDPDVVLKPDETSIARGVSPLRGAAAVANASLVYRARLARPALVDGDVAVIVVARRGRLLGVLRPLVRGERIVEIEILGDLETIGGFEIAVLPD